MTLGNWLSCLPFGPRIGQIGQASATGQALDNAYTRGSAGKCVLVRFIAPVSARLTDVYLFSSSLTGSATASCDLCNYTDPDTLGSLVESTTWTCNGANKWNRATFASNTLTAGSLYVLVIGDPDGAGANFATVLYQGGIGETANQRAILQSYTSTNGGSTWTTRNAGPLVLKFADGSVYGVPFTTNTVDANNARERGVRIRLTERLLLAGLGFNSTSGANINGAKIYADATAPGGTALVSFSAAAGVNSFGHLLLSAPYQLEAKTWYRVVLTYSGNSTSPGYLQVQDSAAYADVLGATFLGGSAYHTIDDGAGGWTDATDKWPRLWLLCSEQVFQARGRRRRQAA